MRTHPYGQFVEVRPIMAMFFWRTCRLCRLRFRWENGFIVSTELCLLYPDLDDRRDRIVVRYEGPRRQCLCADCGKLLLGEFPLQRPSEDLRAKWLSVAQGLPPEPRIVNGNRHGWFVRMLSRLIPKASVPEVV